MAEEAILDEIEELSLTLNNFLIACDKIQGEWPSKDELIEKLNRVLNNHIETGGLKTDAALKHLFWKCTVLYAWQIFTWKEDIRKESVQEINVAKTFPELFSKGSKYGITDEVWRALIVPDMICGVASHILNTLLAMMDMISAAEPAWGIFRVKYNGVAIDSLDRIDDFWRHVQNNDARARAIIFPQLLQKDEERKLKTQAGPTEKKDTETPAYRWEFNEEQQAVYCEFGGNKYGPVKLSKVGYTDGLLLKLFRCLYTQWKKDKNAWVKKCTLVKCWIKKPDYITFVSDTISELRTELKNGLEEQGPKIQGEIIVFNNNKQAPAWRLC